MRYKYFSDPIKNIGVLALLLILQSEMTNAQELGLKKAISGEAQLLAPDKEAQALPKPKYAHAPLISGMYTADPSVRVFNDKLYIYPSHDIATGKPNTNGDHFDMNDYHVFSMDNIRAKPVDHGAAMELSQVKWADRQLWAPDVVEKNGKYYLYFPARDKAGVFRIGVAVSHDPEGPFKPEANFIKGSFSIDPAILQDQGESYIYFGGLWGGQLQKWAKGSYDASENRKDVLEPDQPALNAKVAKLSENMLDLAEPPKELQLLDESGKPILAGDHERRFFEGAWVFKHQETYYFTYSTGDTHLICYATGKSPYGPFTYKGVVLKPVSGWTTHHSIVNFRGQWYLFYHDTERSGKSHLRNIKVAPLSIGPDGVIQTVDPFLQ